MKIELPCEVVRDLLPAYVDGLCGEVTKAAVAEHLAACADCRQTARKMTAEFAESEAENKMNTGDSEGDEQLMRKIKSKLNKKAKIIAACSALVIVLVVAGFNLLFNVPLKEVDLADVSVDVHSYAMEDLVYAAENGGSYTVSGNSAQEYDEDVEVTVYETEAGDADADTEMDGTVIYADEGDKSEVVRLNIPENPNTLLKVSRDVIDKCKDVSVISWSSPYFLRDIRLGATTEGNVMYVRGIRTTLLGNKASESSQTTTYLEMRRIDKVVYVHEDGSEQVLWQSSEKNNGETR